MTTDGPRHRLRPAFRLVWNAAEGKTCVDFALWRRGRDAPAPQPVGGRRYRVNSMWGQPPSAVRRAQLHSFLRRMLLLGGAGYFHVVGVGGVARYAAVKG